MFTRKQKQVEQELGYATVANRQGVLVVPFEGTTWAIEHLNGEIEDIQEGDRVRLVKRGSGPYCCKLFVEKL